MVRIALLDDYQNVAMKSADWNALPADCSVEVFQDHLVSEDAEPPDILLRREMFEETALTVAVHEMLFVAEGERLRGGARHGVWRSFFFRIEREHGEIDLSREPDIVDHRFEPRSTLPGLLDAPYHRGFVRWLNSHGELRHVFDQWID